MVNRPARGVGERSLERLQAFARAQGLSLFDALGRLDEVPDLPGKARKALCGFGELVGSLNERVLTLAAGEAVQEVLKRSGTLERLEAEKTDEAVERVENLMELLAAARELDESEAASPPPQDPDEPPTPPLARFLENIALLGEADAPTPEGRVALMTLHAAKGLEFDAVVLAGMEEGVLPYERPWRRSGGGGEAADVDEERRLCYVGMTRARRLLLLSLARRRMSFGEMGPTWRASEPSRFLGDLPPELFGLPPRASSSAPAAAPPRIRRHPGALEGEPVIELDGDDGPDAGAAADLHAGAGAGAGAGRARVWPQAGASSQGRTGPSSRGRAAAAAGPRVVYDADEQGGLAPGERVAHPSMGEGVVRSVEGRGPDAKVTVVFFDRGEKRVIARFLSRA